MKYKMLLRFQSEELIFDKDETIIVLKFIFTETDHELINSLRISDYLREFAQGLLVEAVDASYAVGFVEAIFRTTTNPTKGAISILKSFGKKAASHWFHHASVNDLQNVEVYQFILDILALNFRIKLVDFVAENVQSNDIGAFIAYSKPQGMIELIG